MRLHDTATVDVLVAPDVEAAELVSILAALRVATPHVTLGIGTMPDEEQRFLRGRPISRMHVRAKHSRDPTALREAIESDGRSLLACFAGAEATTLTLRWVSGRVGPSIVSEDAPASQCIRERLATIELPAAPPLELVIEMRPTWR